MKFDKETIEQLYYNDNLTITDIASRYETSYSTMRRTMKNMGIVIRERGNIIGKIYEKQTPSNKVILSQEQVDSIKTLYENNVTVNDISNMLKISTKVIYRYAKEFGWKRSKSMMSREQYCDIFDSDIVKMYNNGMSTTEIGRHLGLSHRTVAKHLRHNGIELRGLSDSQFAHNKKEKPQELLDYQTMYDMYVVNRLSKKEIAIRFNVAPHVIDRILKSFNIHVRNSSESKVGLFAREKHPKWKGGISGIYPTLRQYFSGLMTNKILERDNHTCQMCGSHKKLHIHHIKPFKVIFDEILSEYPQYNLNDNLKEILEIMKYDSRFLDENNLITYCRDCHLYKVHGYKKKEV